MKTLHRRTFLTKTMAAAALAASTSLPLGTAPAMAQDLPQLRIGLLSFGTVNWEADTVKRLALDTANGFELVIQGYGGNEATLIALQGGDVDAIISDAFLVSRLRAEGQDYTWVPHSLTVGGVIVRRTSDINSPSDLAGKTLGVAGGPTDKSWLLLQAWTLNETGQNIRDLVGDVKFASPFLINQMIEGGEVDAVMSFWNWNARLLSQPIKYRLLIGTDKILPALGVEGAVPLLGWTFSESWASANPAAIDGFLKASLAAKQVLATDDAAWEALKERMRVVDNPVLFGVYRSQYRRGIVTSFDDDAKAVARQAFGILAELGGEALMGPSGELSAGTFWGGFSF